MGRAARIIWNEVDNSQWFDMSPDVNDTQQHIENTPQATIYVARYVAMMQATHNAIALATTLPTMMCALMPACLCLPGASHLERSLHVSACTS